MAAIGEVFIASIQSDGGDGGDGGDDGDDDGTMLAHLDGRCPPLLSAPKCRATDRKGAASRGEGETEQCNGVQWVLLQCILSDFK